MADSLIGRLSPASLVLFVIGVTACRSEKHTVIDAEPGVIVSCRKCYDEVTNVRRAYWSKVPQIRTYTVSTHQCPDCKTEMSIYSEEGVLMVKCGGCAPEGIACARCLPPDGVSR